MTPWSGERFAGSSGIPDKHEKETWMPPKNKEAAVVATQLVDPEDEIEQTAAPDDDDDLGPSEAVSMNSMSAIATRGEDDHAIATDDAPMAASIFMFNSNPDFAPEDVAFQQLKLLQGLSPEVNDGQGSPGQWIVAGYPAMKTCTFVPISQMKTRELRNAEQVLTCQSLDAQTGVGDPGGNCQTCPMNQWRTNPANTSGKNLPPLCSLFYSFYGVVLELDEVAVVRFGKTGIPAAKFMNTLAHTRRKLGGFGTFGVKLEAVKQSNANYSWWTAKPTLAMVSPEALAQARMLANPS